MNNVGSTTLLHPAFNNLEQVIIFGRIVKNRLNANRHARELTVKSFRLYFSKIPHDRNSNLGSKYLYIIIFRKHNMLELVDQRAIVLAAIRN